MTAQRLDAIVIGMIQSKDFPYVPIAKAAKIIGLTTGRLRQLLIAEKIQGFKAGERAWLIALADVQRLAKQRRK